MTTPDQIKQFLLSRKDMHLIGWLGRESGVNAVYIRRFLSGEKYRHLTPEQINKIVPVLQEIGFKLKK